MVIGLLADPESPDLTVRVDGSQGLTAESVTELAALCNRAEEGGASKAVVLQVSGVPGPGWPSDLTVGLVNKWERGLRRLERLPAVTVAVADDDCGGVALDVLLAADYRIMPAGAQLVLPVVAGVTWPGMALYRLARQTAGEALARQAVLFGTPIEANDAQAMGIVDDVPANPVLALERALKVAGAAAAVPGAEFAIRRQLMLEATTTSFEDALGPHLAACDRALRTVATTGA